MTEFLERCRSRAMRRTTLEVRVSNVSAIRFYTRFRFGVTDLLRGTTPTGRAATRWPATSRGPRPNAMPPNRPPESNMPTDGPTARELMTPKPITLSTDAAVSRALGLMREKGIHEIPVLRNPAHGSHHDSSRSPAARTSPSPRRSSTC